MIKSISIRNFKGIKYAKFDLGQITILAGGNGVGKTSFLEAVKAPFLGGYDPTMVRDPEAAGAACIVIGEEPVERKPLAASKAIIEMELADGSTLRREIDRERRTSKVECTSKTGERLGGQGYADSLASVEAVDPMRFLLAEPKERAKVVMQFLDVPLSAEELDFIPGGDWYEAHMRAKDGRKLGCFDALKAVEDACVQRRRDTNRQEGQLEATIQTLRGDSHTLNDVSADYKGLAEEAEAAHRQADGAYRLAKISVEEDAQAARVKATTDKVAGTKEVEAWLAVEIAKLRAVAEERYHAIEQQYSATADAIREAEAKALAAVDAEHLPKIEEARAASQAAKQKLEAYNNAAGLRVHLAKCEKDHKVLVAESLRMDAAIAQIRALRNKKMEEVPIAGLEMRDGEVYYQGLRLDAINTAQQIEVAALIVSQASGTMPFMILDNAEHLDPEMKQRFVEALKAGGFQVVVAQVTEGPLAVYAE